MVISVNIYSQTLYTGIDQNGKNVWANDNTKWFKIDNTIEPNCASCDYPDILQNKEDVYLNAVKIVAGKWYYSTTIPQIKLDFYRQGRYFGLSTINCEGLLYSVNNLDAYFNNDVHYYSLRICSNYGFYCDENNILKCNSVFSEGTNLAGNVIIQTLPLISEPVYAYDETDQFADKFLKGDVVTFKSASYSSEYKVFKMNGGEWTEFDSNTAIAGENYDFDICEVLYETFRIKFKDGAYYSSNYVEKTIEVYQKPELVVSDKTYACTNPANINFKISAFTADEIKVTLFKDGAIYTNYFYNKAEHYDDKTYTLNVESGSYVISAENKVGDSYIGYSDYPFLLESFPTVNFNMEDVILNCPDNSINYTIPNTIPSIPASSSVWYALNDDNFQITNSFQIGLSTQNVAKIKFKTVEGQFMCEQQSNDFDVNSLVDRYIDFEPGDLTSGICDPNEVLLNLNLTNYDVSNEQNIQLAYKKTTDANFIMYNRLDPPAIIEGNYNLRAQYSINNNQICPTTKQESLLNAFDALSIANFQVENVKGCNEAENASISFDCLGGNELYTFKLNDQSISINKVNGHYYIDNLSVGQYQLEVFSRGCTVQKNFEIILVDELKINLQNITDNSYCSSSKLGAIEVVLQGGNPNYQLSLYNSNNDLIEKRADLSLLNYEFEDLNNGDYRLEVMDEENCLIEMSSISVGLDNILSIVDYSKVNVKGCLNEENGSVYFKVSGGIAPYTYILLKDNTSIKTIVSANKEIEFSQLPIGNYKIKVESAGVCELMSDNVTIVLEDEFKITQLLAHDVSGCFSNSNGSLDIQQAGFFNGSFNYSVTGPVNQNGQASGNFSINNLLKGTYNLSISSEKCTDNESFNMDGPDKISFTSSHTANLACSYSNSGLIEFLSVTDGISSTFLNYQFSIDNGNTWNSSSLFNNLLKGNYTLIARKSDEYSCVSDVKNLSISAPEILVLESQIIEEIKCFGEDATLSYLIYGGTQTYNLFYSQNNVEHIISNINSGNFILPSGTVDVWAKDKNNCQTNTMHFNLTEPDDLQITDVSITDASCVGISDGKINFEIIGGTANFQAKLYKNAVLMDSKSSNSFVEFNLLLAGNYRIQIEDGNGCLSSDYLYTVKNLGSPIISANSQNLSCFESEDGQIQVTAFLENANLFSFSINGGQSILGNDIIFQNLPSDNYEISVTEEGRNCPSTTSVYISQPEVLQVVTEFKRNVSCLGANDGVISIELDGGTYPYKVDLKKNGLEIDELIGISDFASFTNLSAGVYELFITDSKNCQLTKLVQLNNPLTELSFKSLISVPVDCKGNSTGKLAFEAEGGWAKYKYWIDGVNTNSDSTQNIYSELCAGEYAVHVKDSLGATISSTIQVLEPEESLNAFLSNQINVDCFGNHTGSFTLNLSGGTGTYDLFLNDVLVSSNIEELFVVDGLSAANYEFLVKDSNSCRLEGNVIISEPERLKTHVELPDYNGYNTACFRNSDTITIWAEGGTLPYNFHFLDTSVIVAQTFSISSKMEHNLEVHTTDFMNCKDSLLVVLQAPEKLLFSEIQMSQPSCFNSQNGKVFGTVTGGVESSDYHFFLNGLDSNNDTINRMLAGESFYFEQLFSGSYRIRVLDANNCSQDTIIFLTEPEKLQTTLLNIDSVKCYGNNSGSFKIEITGGTSEYLFLLNSDTFQTNGFVLISNLKADNYPFKIVDSNNCEWNDSIEIVEPEKLSALISLNTYNDFNVRCNGDMDSAWVKINGGIMPYFLTVEDETLEINHKNWTVFDSLEARNYEWYIRDSNTCEDTVDFKIIESEKLQISTLFIQNPTCFNYSDAHIILQAENGLSTLDYMYQLYNSDTDEHFVETGQRVEIDFLKSGAYLITVKDQNECYIDSAFTINEPDSIQIHLVKKDVKCFGEESGSIYTDIEGGTIPYTFSWYDEDDNSISAYKDLIGMPLGEYKLVIRDFNNCKLFGDSTGNFPEKIIRIEQPDHPLDLQIESLKNVICFGEGNGNVVLNANGGWGNYVYKLGSFYSENNSFEQLASADYWLFVKDSLSCTDSIMVSIRQPDLLKVDSIVRLPVACYGDNTGFAEIFTSGGVGLHSYNLNFTHWQKENQYDSLTAGEYLLQVLDTNYCSLSTEFLIQEPAEIDLDLVQVQNSVSCKANGLIEIQAKGGKIPYLYQWFENAGFQIGSIADSLNTGEYYVGITDSNNCYRELFASTISREDGPDISIKQQQDASCITTNDGYVELEVDFDGISEVTWNDEQMQKGFIASNLLTGKYIAEIKTEGECLSYFEVFIDAPEPIKYVWTKSDVSCKYYADGSIITEVSGGVQPYIINWFDSDSNLISIDNEVNDLKAGMYYFYLNDKSSCSNSLGYIISDSVVIEEPTMQMELNLLGKQEVSCFGLQDGFVELKASGGNGEYLYSKDNITYSDEKVYGNLFKGEYNYYVKDSKNCLDSIFVSIMEPKPLSLSVSDLGSITCNGNSDGYLKLNSVGGNNLHQYRINEQGPFSLSSAFYNLNASFYKVELIDEKLCQDSIWVEITEPKPLRISLDSLKNSWCSENNAIISVNGIGGTKEYTFIWPDLLNVSGSFADKLNAGIFRVEVFDANNCFSDTTIQIIDYPSPKLDVIEIKDATCSYSSNGSLKLSIEKGTSPFVFDWYNVHATDSLFAYDLAKGNYKMSVQDSHTCSDTINFVINAPDSLRPQQIELKHPLCFGDCTGEIEIMLTGGTPEYQIEWEDSVLAGARNNLQEGVYSYKILDRNGCEYKDSVQLKYPQKLKIDSVNIKHSWCSEPNGKIQVFASGGTGNLVYNWTELSWNSQILSDRLKGDYKLEIQDDHFCILDTTFQILEFKAPTLNIENLINASCSYSNDGYVKLNILNGTEPYYFNWNDEVQNFNNDLAMLSKGSYFVTVKDYYNCFDSLRFTINAPDSIYIIPKEIKDPTCYNYTDGQILVTAIGGTTPYRFLWDNLQTSGRAINLGAGSFNVTLLDANDCVSQKQFDLTNPIPINIDLVDSANICSNQNLVFDVGNESLYHFWYNNFGFTAYTPIVELSDTGKYFIRINDIQNCYALDSLVLIGSKEEIEAAFIMPSLAYVGDTIVLIEVSWPLPDSINWNVPDAFDLVYDNYYEVHLKTIKEGVFLIGLNTYNDICTESRGKIIEILPGNQKPKEINLGNNLKIVNVNVWPAPVQDRLFIEIELSATANISLELTNLFGQKQMQEKLSGSAKYSLEINTSHLQAGIYLLRIRAENVSKTIKLIKE